MTEPDPGFVPLSERLDEVWSLLLQYRTAETGKEWRIKRINAALATLTEAIETLQDVEARG